MKCVFTKMRAGVASVLVAGSFVGMLAVHAEPETAYLDNRSTPQSLVESYYNAINQKQYVRAYSYFSKGWAPQDYAAWVAGYATTQHVSIRVGATYPDPGAGQVHWALPVALSVVTTEGQQVVYAGCYAIHMTNVFMQIDPPFAPMSINAAKLKKSPLLFEAAVPKAC